MARKPAGGPPGRPSPMLFAEAQRRRHLRLFLPRFLDAEAAKPIVRDASVEAAHKIIQQWADHAEKGNLSGKETSLDAEFLEKIFGDALGYKSVSESPREYHREKQFYVAGAGTADGALGKFSVGEPFSPVAIIELKGADADLDHDKFNNRTPVQQCWDYLRELPDCPWGIVSNLISIRLYHRDRTTRAYEEYTFQDLRDPHKFAQFYCIFHKYGLLGNKYTEPRALTLLKQTQDRQREVGDELYDEYSAKRLALIHHLVADHGQTDDRAIHIAQKILDRIIFVAFCEDRGLIDDGTIARAYSQLPPFTKVTNPRWQAFKTLFSFIDRGNSEAGIPEYNGGLFRNDDEVDSLELSDDWTHFFRHVTDYDFKDEVNVDVLGHLFERSVTELEKLRVVGMFGLQTGGADGQPQMLKSAHRKRFGIYYTPPAFTEFIVNNTLGALLEQRVAPLDDPHQQIAELRTLSVCDPACGSGAFLIAAYDRLFDAYDDALRLFRIAGEDTRKLEEQVPDWILSENLYGVDVSEESVEITQLALWLRSARRGRTLANLAKNIVRGNSLVRDERVHEHAFSWVDKFPQIFKSQRQGFDAVIGNPPWERMKLQEREFFALAAPEIASAVNAAQRRKLIAQVESSNPELWKRYQTAQGNASETLDYVRSCGHFPLTGRGDVNTYMVFAELARQIVAPTGRVGALVPSGIATDDTTKDFFTSLIHHQSLIALYDFENRDKVFADVDGRFKFCVLLVGGTATGTASADFVFFARQIEDLGDPERHVTLSAKDLKLLNPNTRTCPIFRTKRDASLTKHIYRNVPILVDENRREGGNPWGVKFATMFHQTNDAELFRSGKDLQDEGFRLDGNRWIRRKEVYLPLYEAKMVQAYDHRAASVIVEAGNWMRQGQPEPTSLVEHQNPEFCALPRYWVAETAVNDVMKKPRTAGFVGFKDITSSTNQRTMLAAAIPWSAVTNHFPILLTDLSQRLQACLLANLNALPFDYAARQKVGGVTLNFFIVEQLPTLPPDRYADKCPWSKRVTLESWISERVLKLTCTANDMVSLAEAADFSPTVYRWNESERAQLRAELDVAYFILYGIERDDIEYILSTFQGIAKEDESLGGIGPTRRLILDCFDDLSARAAS